MAQYTVSGARYFRFDCDDRRNQLEVRVYRFTGHGLSKFVRRSPRRFVASLGLIALLVSLLAAHCAVIYSDGVPTVVGTSVSISTDVPAQNSASAESSSICDKDCLEGSGSPLFLIVCSVVLAVIGLALWAMYAPHPPRLSPRTKGPIEYWPRQLQLFPTLFSADRLKLSVIRI